MLPSASATVPSSAVRSCQPSRLSSAARSFSSSGGLTRALNTCPPSNPMLIFWGFSCSAMFSVRSLGGLHDLGQDPTGAGGVHEGYSGAADADSRPLVDQPHARRPERFERLIDRGDAVGHVV